MSLRNALVGAPLLSDLVEPKPDVPRRKGRSLPTQRSKRLLEEAGWLVAITERWNPFAHVRQDLFGFGDLLAVNEDLGVLMVQTTSAPNLSKRIEKMNTECFANLKKCLESGVNVEVHGWGKRGLRGERKLWTCRVVGAYLKEDPATNSTVIEWREERS